MKTRFQTDFGMTLVDCDGGWLVDAVAPGGPAAAAGIEPGDVIVRCHGYPLAGVLAPLLRERLTPPCALHVRDHRSQQVFEMRLGGCQ